MTFSYCNINTGIYRTEIGLDYIPILDEKPASTEILGTLQFAVPGVDVACLILEAVFQSNLNCPYNDDIVTRNQQPLISLF
jgi:hypothetical protein